MIPWEYSKLLSCKRSKTYHDNASSQLDQLLHTGVLSSVPWSAILLAVIYLRSRIQIQDTKMMMIPSDLALDPLPFFAPFLDIPSLPLSMGSRLAPQIPNEAEHTACTMYMCSLRKVPGLCRGKLCWSEPALHLLSCSSAVRVEVTVHLSTNVFHLLPLCESPCYNQSWAKLLRLLMVNSLSYFVKIKN